MPQPNLKPAHAAVKKYNATLNGLARGRFDKEGNSLETVRLVCGLSALPLLPDSYSPSVPSP